MEAIHRYVVDFARRHGGRVLDYGCGRGEMVEGGRADGLDMVGADIFYAGNDSREVVQRKGILNRIVFEIRDGRLPFDDATFDLVVSNQVFEHVHDLDQVLGEIARVLRPGGSLLTLFPAKDVWREGHCGIPFAHWFGRRSRLRHAYILAWRFLGFGYFKEGKTRVEFARGWGEYLDDFTRYRTRRELAELFARHFEETRHLEADYVATRLHMRGNALAARMASFGPVRPVAAWTCGKLSTLVFHASKPKRR